VRLGTYCSGYGLAADASSNWIASDQFGDGSNLALYGTLGLLTKLEPTTVPLLKPYDKERFAKALAHARQVLEQRGKANRDLEPLLQSLRSLRPLERFVVKDKKRIFFVPVSHVLWIEATGNYACIHTASDSHLLRETLTRLEEKLAPHHFIRVRKSAIVNSARISEIRPMFDGVYDIILAEGTVVTSSRRYAHKLRALLES
jgi:two-component system, LytTR family, response regulator